MPPVPQPASSTGPALVRPRQRRGREALRQAYAGRDTTTCGPRPRACARIRPVPRRVRPLRVSSYRPLMISSSCLANRHDQTPDSPAEHRTAPAPAADRAADPVAGRLLLPAHQPRRRRHPRRVGALGERRAALCRGDRREPAAHLRRARPAGADLQDPARRSLVLVHRLGGGRHLRLVLGLPPPGEAGAVGRPCADRGAAAAGPAVPVHRAAQRAFRPARAHPVRGLRALHDRLDGARRGRHAGAAARRSPSAWSPAWRWR